MELSKMYHEFMDRTGMLLSDIELEALEISPCDQFGGFRRSRIPELQSLCKKNPEIHIVSWLNPNVMLNRFAPGARLFFLATGDPDPQLVYDTTATEQDLEVLELRAAQRAS